RREDRPFNADAAEVARTIGLADWGDALRESPENSLGMIRVFCSTPLRCGFGFESWSRGGDDGSSHGRGDCVVQGCRPEVDRTQAQGVPGPGDLGLLGREHLESGARLRVVSPYRGAGVERTANWDHLPGKFFRSGKSQDGNEISGVGSRHPGLGGSRKARSFGDTIPNSEELSMVSPELNEGAMTDLVIPRRFLVSIGDCFGRPVPEDNGRRVATAPGWRGRRQRLRI